MANNKLAIIGGSGLYDVEEFKERELIENILVVNNLPKSKQQLRKENNNG